MYLMLQMNFVKMYYVAQCIAPSRPVFCYVTCAFLSQDKIALVWLKEKQCTQVISQWKTQRVYCFSAVFIINSCGGPAVARKQKKRKCKNPPDSGREPKVSVWLYIVKICSERRLCECSNRLTRQIFIKKINIREEICYCITAYLIQVCENSTYLDKNCVVGTTTWIPNIDLRIGAPDSQIQTMSVLYT
jgi:hypothetical protein